MPQKDVIANINTKVTYKYSYISPNLNKSNIIFSERVTYCIRH